MVEQILLTTLILLLSLSHAAQRQAQPSAAEVAFNRAMELQRQGQWPEAADAWRKFLELEPRHAGAHANLGAVLSRLGQYDEAVKSYDDALRLDPRLTIDRLAATSTGAPFAHLLRGQNYLADSDFQHAVEALEAAGKLSDDLPRLHFSLGVAYLRAGRNEEAIRAFERELKRMPRDYWTLYYLAFLHDAEGQLDAAREKAQLALTLQPRSADAGALLGKVLLKQGRAAEAVTPLETAVAQNPNDSNLRFQLARAYQQSGRRQDAAREFAEAQRLKDRGIEKERKGATKP